MSKSGIRNQNKGVQRYNFYDAPHRFVQTRFIVTRLVTFVTMTKLSSEPHCQQINFHSMQNIVPNRTTTADNSSFESEHVCPLVLLQLPIAVRYTACITSWFECVPALSRTFLRRRNETKLTGLLSLYRTHSSELMVQRAISFAIQLSHYFCWSTSGDLGTNDTFKIDTDIDWHRVAQMMLELAQSRHSDVVYFIQLDTERDFIRIE